MSAWPRTYGRPWVVRPFFLTIEGPYIQMHTSPAVGVTSAGIRYPQWTNFTIVDHERNVCLRFVPLFFMVIVARNIP